MMDYHFIIIVIVTIVVIKNFNWFLIKEYSHLTILELLGILESAKLSLHITAYEKGKKEVY